MSKYRLPVQSISLVSQRFGSTITPSTQTRHSGSPLKNIGKPDKINVEYWKKILWVAMDLKEIIKQNNKNNLHLLDTQHVTLLFTKPHGRFELSFTLACDLLGVRKTLYLDPYFENQPNPGDHIRILSQLTNMFITHGLHHEVLLQIINNTPLPIYSASCNAYCFQKALSDMMTFLEKFRRLKNLTLTWIGPPIAIFNAYLLLCSEFGMRVRYTCICLYGSGQMSPVHRHISTKLDEFKAEIHRSFRSVREAVKDSQIIITSMHPEEKNQITLDVLQEADPNWVFMHTMPRSKTEVTDEVFYHEKNLSWETTENYLYVAMAVILVTLKNYNPKIKMPDFDGVEKK